MLFYYFILWLLLYVISFFLFYGVWTLNPMSVSKHYIAINILVSIGQSVCAMCNNYIFIFCLSPIALYSYILCSKNWFSYENSSYILRILINAPVCVKIYLSCINLWMVWFFILRKYLFLPCSNDCYERLFAFVLYRLRISDPQIF